MTGTVDYYFSMASPWAYLGIGRFRALVKKHRAVAVFRPVDLVGTVFPATGGVALGQRPPARRAYRLVELKRWSRYLGIPLNPEPKFFPVDDKRAAGTAIAAREAGEDIGPFCEGVLRAVWAEERDISDPDVLRAIAKDAELDRSYVDRGLDDDVQARFAADSSEAIERGVFGAPFMFYRDEPFWGQDRLDFLDRALAQD